MGLTEVPILGNGGRQNNWPHRKIRRGNSAYARGQSSRLASEHGGRITNRAAFGVRRARHVLAADAIPGRGVHVEGPLADCEQKT